MNRYNKVEIIDNKRIFREIKYPQIPYSINDIYIISNDVDRYDLIAQKFYKDISLWWIIPIANPQLPLDTLYPPPGTQLRIPMNIQEIITNFTLMNG